MAMVYLDAGELCERHTEETETLLEKQAFEMENMEEDKKEKAESSKTKHKKR